MKKIKRIKKNKISRQKNRKQIRKKKIISKHNKIQKFKKKATSRRYPPKRSKLKLGSKHAVRRVSTKRTKGKYRSEDGSVLETLFGATPKVRLINLFFRNEAVSFSVKELAERTKLNAGIISRECNTLTAGGILMKHASGVKRSYKLNLSFPFLAEFHNLVQRSFPIEKNKLISIAKRSGKLRLILVSGLFLNRDDSPVDLFVVADNLSERRLESAIKEIESLIGKELRWAGMETQEFLYRWRMFDRFVHDLLSAPHEKIYINKLNLV